MKLEKYDRLDRQLVKKGAIIDIYEDTIRVPNGSIAKWDYIGHRGAAAVLAVTSEGKILMVRQYRNALDRFTLEIPAGGRTDEEESMKVCALRELEEETGYRSDNLELLLSLRTTVAFCNERIDVYVADNLIKTEQNLDEDEFLNVEEHSLDELCEMIYRGEIQDSKTVSAILAYKDKYVKK